MSPQPSHPAPGLFSLRHGATEAPIELRRPTTQPDGWTLLELLVGVAVTGVFSLALLGFYRFSLHSLSAETAKLEVRENSRLALDFVVRELRMAGARPVSGGGCDGFARLLRAEANAIAFQYDFRGRRRSDPADGCPDDPSERVAYTYDDTNRMLRRATGNGSAQPFIPDLAANGFRLTYFDRNGAQLAPPLDAAGRAAVWLIDVRIQTSRAHPDPEVAGPVTSELWSAVFLPNPPA